MDINNPRGGSGNAAYTITDLCLRSRKTFIEVIHGFSVQQDLISPEFGISQIMVDRNCDQIQQCTSCPQFVLFLTIPNGTTCTIIESNTSSGKPYLEEDVAVFIK